MNEQLQVPVEYAPAGDGSGNGQNHSRQDLIARVCAAEMALHRTQGMLDRKDQAIEALKQQLADANAATQQANANLAGSPQNVVSQVAQARCAELEQEVATLRQALEGLNANGGQQQGNPQVEAELRQQLDAANNAWRQHADASQNAQGRCAELEQELATAQQMRDDLASKLAAEQKVTAQTTAQFQQLQAANTAWQQNASANQDAQSRCAQLEQELTTVRQLRDDLANKLAAEQKVSVQTAAQLKEMAAKSAAGGSGDSDVELQLRQAVAALAKATAELAQERGQRQRSEHRAGELNTRLQTMHHDLTRTLQTQQDDLARINTLEEQTRQATQALEQKTSELEQHRAERLLAEEQLHKAKQLTAQLQKDIAFLEESNKKFESGRQELQSKLEASVANLRESEARLQQEKAERLRLSEALDAIQRKAGDSSERDLEFSKLQSMLQHEQVERNRKEAQLAHVRHSAVDAAQAARALRANLRRQVREPVDSLANSARSLLELEMGEEQKKLAAAVLEDVLLVQTRLREPDNAGEPAENAPAEES
jgi:chromosome segregation ATPase